MTLFNSMEILTLITVALCIPLTILVGTLGIKWDLKDFAFAGSLFAMPAYLLGFMAAVYFGITLDTALLLSGGLVFSPIVGALFGAIVGGIVAILRRIYSCKCNWCLLNNAVLIPLVWGLSTSAVVGALATWELSL